MTRNIHPVINIFLGLLRPFIYANFWVAGAVWALTRLTEFQWTQWWQDGTFDEYNFFELNPSLAGLNAAGTLIVYGFARLFDSPGEDGLQSKISQWRLAMPKTAQLSMGLGVAYVAVWWALHGSWNLMYLYAGAIAVAALYPLPFILRKSGGGLRSIPGLKLVFVAAVWAYVTAVIPSVSAGTFTIGVFFERFWWTAALILPFDVRDMMVDQGSIRTLPHMIGPRNTVWLANLMLWFSFFIQIQLFQMPLAQTLVLYLLCSFIIVLANPKLGDLYYSLLIEGLPFLLLGLWVLSPYL
tara:strand:- start:1379 stop:2269 length:891 start_codon:yes stop_codon:yes gene_type:complete